MTRMGYGGTILIPRSPHGETRTLGARIYNFTTLIRRKVLGPPWHWNSRFDSHSSQECFVLLCR